MRSEQMDGHYSSSHQFVEEVDYGAYNKFLEEAEDLFGPYNQVTHDSEELDTYQEFTLEPQEDAFVRETVNLNQKDWLQTAGKDWVSDPADDWKAYPPHLVRLMKAQKAVEPEPQTPADLLTEETDVLDDPETLSELFRDICPSFVARQYAETPAEAINPSLDMCSLSENHQDNCQTIGFGTQKLDKNVGADTTGLEAAFTRFYLLNEINLCVWERNPVLKRLLPILKDPTSPVTPDIMQADKRRPEQMTLKIHIVICDLLFNDTQFINLLGKERENLDFKGKTSFKAEHRQYMANQPHVFAKISTIEFFETVSQKLFDDTRSDVKTNFLNKFIVDDPDQQSRALDSCFEEDGITRARAFKRPLTVMENYWSIILYCNELLHELRDSAVAPVQDNRYKISQIKEHFLQVMRSKNLYNEKLCPLPSKPNRAVKDLRFQAYLKVV